MSRFLCTGDLHLGAHPQYAADRLADQEKVWDSMLERAADEGVDAVLFAGDAFEGPLATPEQLEAFVRPIEKRKVSVVAITGNGRHDSAMRDYSALAALRHVPGLSVVSEPAASQTDDGTWICCLPWTSTRHLPVDQAGELVARAAEDLLHRTARPDENAVLMLHYSISGAELPNGLPVDQLHEAIVPVEALAEQGWAAVVAGHIHKPQHLFEQGFYVGSPMPLNFGEAETPHGCFILEVGNGPARFEFFEVASRPMVTLDWDGEVLADPSTLPLLGDRPELDGAIVRLRYTATEQEAAAIDNAYLRRNLEEHGAHRVFIQPTIIRQQRARVEAMTEDLSDRQALELWLKEQSGVVDPALFIAPDLLERHDEYVKELA